jgi:hypothetical protein
MPVLAGPGHLVTSRKGHRASMTPNLPPLLVSPDGRRLTADALAAEMDDQKAPSPTVFRLLLRHGDAEARRA